MIVVLGLFHIECIEDDVMINYDQFSHLIVFFNIFCIIIFIINLLLITIYYIHG